MKISFFSLVILIVAGIDNLKNMPSVALLGSSMIFFFALAALLFLIPTALVSAELSSLFPNKGGVYEWIKRAFGGKWALVAVWFQWINTMIWYPTMLSFIGATFAYMVNPEWAENRWYLVGSMLSIFWALTFVNLKGVRTSSKVVNYCSLVGMVLPMMCLIGAGVFWWWNGYSLEIQFDKGSLLPSFSSTDNWVSLVAIMASFLGIELCGVHINEIDKPKKNFPRAVLIACIFIFLSMGLSSMAIASIIPQEKINLLAGVMQVFQHFLDMLGLSKLAPVAAFLIGFGAVGTMVNWLIAPAKGLLQAAEDGYLPQFLTKKNKHGVASKILIGQAILISLFSMIFLLPGSPRDSFWMLTALSTELYMIMYLLMFAAALKLRHAKTEIETHLVSTKSLWGLSGLGVLGCLITIFFSFLPPVGGESGFFGYALQVLGGNIFAITPLWFFYRYKSVARVVQSHLAPENPVDPEAVG